MCALNFDKQCDEDAFFYSIYERLEESFPELDKKELERVADLIIRLLETNKEEV